MYLKILFVFTVIAVSNSLCDKRKAVAFVPEVTDHLLKTVKQCMLEFDDDPKVIELIREGSYGEDEPFKKFVRCAYYRSGYANEDGTVIADKVIKAFPADANIGPVTKNCSKIRGKDALDTTYEFFKCFQINAPIRIALM